MTFDFANMITDDSRENNGAPVQYQGVTFHLRRFGCDAHNKFIENARKPYLPIIKAGGQIPDDVAERIAIDSMVEAIVVDWEGTITYKGEELSYSKENCRRLLNEVKQVRLDLAQESTKLSNFKSQQLDNDAKN